MERLSGDPRPFRLFLEYWALGVRNALIRRRVSAALDRYRGSFREIGSAALAGRTASHRMESRRNGARSAGDGLAATAVSFIHGCALQAVIDPNAFSVRQHFDAAARMLDGFLS
jgi:hypothetical protein